MSQDGGGTAARVLRALLLGAIVLNLGLVFEWRSGPTAVAALVAFLLGLLLFVVLPRLRRTRGS